MTVSTIDNTQNAYFAISPIAANELTFSQNCTYIMNGMSYNCSAPPVSADTNFTGQGLANSGTYSSMSESGFTTSGNILKGQLCMINQISSDMYQIQQYPICSITKIYSATTVTSSYWNYNT